MKLQESMDKCTSHHDKTEIRLKMALNTKQSYLQKIYFSNAKLKLF